MSFAYSLFTDDSLISLAKQYDIVSPAVNLAIDYTFVREEFDVKIYSDMNFFSSGIYDNDSFVSLGVYLTKSFDNINSKIELDIGSNLTSALDIPKIPLPYLYYSIALNNKLFSDKINLKIGWQYEMYNAVLKNYDDIAGVVPENYPNILNLEEDLILNKLYLTLDYLF